MCLIHHILILLQFMIYVLTLELHIQCPSSIHSFFINYIPSKTIPFMQVYLPIQESFRMDLLPTIV